MRINNDVRAQGRNQFIGQTRDKMHPIEGGHFILMPFLFQNSIRFGLDKSAAIKNTFIVSDHTALRVYLFIYKISY